MRPGVVVRAEKSRGEFAPLPSASTGMMFHTAG